MKNTSNQTENAKEDPSTTNRKIDLSEKGCEFVLISSGFPCKSDKNETSIAALAKQVYALKEDGVQNDTTILKILARNILREKGSG